MTGLRPRHQDGEGGEEDNNGEASSEAAPQGVPIIVAPLTVASCQLPVNKGFLVNWKLETVNWKLLTVSL